MASQISLDGSNNYGSRVHRWLCDWSEGRSSTLGGDVEKVGLPRLDDSSWLLCQYGRLRLAAVREQTVSYQFEAAALPCYSGLYSVSKDYRKRNLGQEQAGRVSKGIDAATNRMVRSTMSGQGNPTSSRHYP